MPRKGYSPEKILNKLRQVEVAVANGKRVGQAVREIGVSENTHSTSLRAGSTTVGGASMAGSTLTRRGGSRSSSRRTHG